MSTPTESTAGFVRSAERVIAAPPARVFAILADPARHAEIDGSGTVRGVKASQAPLRAGSTFDVHMRRGFRYTTRNTVVEFEQDRVLAWSTRPLTLPLALLIGGRIWRYELEEVAAGTHLVETWDLRPERNRSLVRPLAGDPQRDMQRTLGRIAELAERER